MSHAEHASKPLPVFTKLAALLRNISAVRFVFAKFAALRREKVSAEPLISRFLGDTPGVTNNTVDQQLDMLESTGDMVIAVPKPNDQSEREKLIRRAKQVSGLGTPRCIMGNGPRSVPVANVQGDFDLASEGRGRRSRHYSAALARSG